jgi:hypothetical protein
MIPNRDTWICPKKLFILQIKNQRMALWTVFDLLIKQHPGSSCMVNLCQNVATGIHFTTKLVSLQKNLHNYLNKLNTTIASF